MGQQNQAPIDYDALQAQAEKSNPDDGQTHGEAYLQSLNPGMAGLLRKYGTGELPLPSAGRMGAANPRMMMLMEALTRAYPGLDIKDINARNQTMKAFTAPGREAEEVKSINTATQHLAGLMDLVSGLHNSPWYYYNEPANYLRTKLTGWTGQTDFETRAPQSVAEIVRLWKGAGGNESDANALRKVLDPSNAPGQLYSTMGEFADLMEGRLNALQQMYDEGMKGQQPRKLVTPQTQAVIDKLRALRTGQTPGPAGPGVPGVKLLKIENLGPVKQE